MNDDPIRRGRAARLARIGTCLLAAGGVDRALAESAANGTSVVGVRAGSVCLREQIRITGFAMPREESGASVPFEGYRITELFVSEGDSVTLGQELLRAIRLGADDPAQAGPAQARQALPTSFSLRAPIAGRITRVNARIGMTTQNPAAAPPAAPGMPPEPTIRIMADAGIDLLVDVPSLYATKIRSGLTARVVTGDGIEAKGTVRVPVSEVDPATQLGRARLAIDPATSLRPGQFASATIETARDCGLSVPRSAVSYQNGVPTVQVLSGGSIETRSVRTGLFDDNTIQIREGISEGEPVVANAGTSLRSGDRVIPVIPDATAPGGRSETPR